jgi:hypothetical protein
MSTCGKNEDLFNEQESSLTEINKSFSACNLNDEVEMLLNRENKVFFNIEFKATSPLETPKTVAFLKNFFENKSKKADENVKRKSLVPVVEDKSEIISNSKILPRDLSLNKFFDSYTR